LPVAEWSRNCFKTRSNNLLLEEHSIIASCRLLLAAAYHSITRRTSLPKPQCQQCWVPCCTCPQVAHSGLLTPEHLIKARIPIAHKAGEACGTAKRIPIAPRMHTFNNTWCSYASFSCRGKGHCSTANTRQCDMLLAEVWPPSSFQPYHSQTLPTPLHLFTATPTQHPLS
jgi:hypothetical protein